MKCIKPPPAMCKRGFIVKRKVKPYFVFVEVFVESRGFEQSTHTKSNLKLKYEVQQKNR